MMNIQAFIEFLNKKKGLHLDASYYANIAAWKQWWMGYVESIHKVGEMGADGVIRTRRMASLRMPKHACQDWATLLLNDKTKVILGDRESARWLLGNEDQTGGILEKLHFWTNANSLVEQTFRSGTGAFVLSVEGMQVSSSGQVVPNPDAKICMDYLPAECIIPITIRHGKVLSCAFVSQVQLDGRSCVYLQTHRLEEDGYTITNEYFTSCQSDGDTASYKEAPTPEGIAREFHTGSPLPWFSLFSPGECKNISGGDGLGMAVFSEAVDAARLVDLAFDNYTQDMSLGGKKVFYNKRLTRTYIDKDGNEHMVAPDAIRQQQFFLLPGEDDPDAKAQWYEYNPNLRVEDNSKAVQDALDYFSFKCGLGTHHYQFQAGNIATATQYTGDRQDMVQHANRHQIGIEAALIAIVRAMLWAGRNMLGASVDPDTEVLVSFDDSYIIDTESRLANMKDDAVHGFLPRYKYLMERYGYDEQTARDMVAEAAAENRSEDNLFFGGE